MMTMNSKGDTMVVELVIHCINITHNMRYPDVTDLYAPYGAASVVLLGAETNRPSHNSRADPAASIQVMVHLLLEVQLWELPQMPRRGSAGSASLVSADCGS
jgi:hypothetical protein